MYQPAHDYGSVHIADEVIGIIAGLAATEIEGVKSMTGGFAGGLVELLGKKNLSKGVKVEVGEKEAKVDLYLVIEYGAVVHAVATKVQENVKKAVEGMTGLKMVEVNVFITGIDTHMPKVEHEEERKEEKKQEEKEESKKGKKGKKGRKEKKEEKEEKEEKVKQEEQEKQEKQEKKGKEEKNKEGD